MKKRIMMLSAIVAIMALMTAAAVMAKKPSQPPTPSVSDPTHTAFFDGSITGSGDAWISNPRFCTEIASDQNVRDIPLTVHDVDCYENVKHCPVGVDGVYSGSFLFFINADKRTGTATLIASFADEDYTVDEKGEKDTGWYIIEAHGTVTCGDQPIFNPTVDEPVLLLWNSMNSALPQTQGVVDGDFTVIMEPIE